MTTAWVADDGGGRVFWAYIEVDTEGPWVTVNGPNDVAVEEAVGWARAHADEVRLRIGPDHYSAGTTPIPEYPAWEGNATPAGAAPVGRTRQWRVRARTGWYRDDRREIAAALALAIDREPDTTGSTAELHEAGFEVEFHVPATSRLAADEHASRIVRSAWDTLGVTAVAGDDYDGASILVEEA